MNVAIAWRLARQSPRGKEVMTCYRFSFIHQRQERYMHSWHKDIRAITVRYPAMYHTQHQEFPLDSRSLISHLLLTRHSTALVASSASLLCWTSSLEPSDPCHADTPHMGNLS
ncbi:hypothetical protein I7I48_03059 [Histoplasma ohiense]|nr:hypothetical protein I7I48_03059 [Histoplasma ohiense (nom. inval.)]